MDKHMRLGMNERILIVEDNPDERELMEYLLSESGYITVTATDGKEAIEAANNPETRPALIVCDVELRPLDGYEIARQIKGDTASRDIPLVAVTDSPTVGDHDKVIAAGFSGCLAKPVNSRTFVKQIETYLHAA